MRKDLHTIKLAGLSSTILICDSCKSKDPEEQYKTAANILQDITDIAKGNDSVEDRLARIKEPVEFHIDHGDRTFVASAFWIHALDQVRTMKDRPRGEYTPGFLSLPYEKDP